MKQLQIEHFAKLKRAREKTLEFASAKGVPLVHIEHVATFEDWDKGIEVWFFYETDAQIFLCESSGASRQIIDAYRQALVNADYSFHDYPEVIWMFGSKENVDAKFNGDYYYRVR